MYFIIFVYLFVNPYFTICIKYFRYEKTFKGGSIHASGCVVCAGLFNKIIHQLGLKNTVSSPLEHVTCSKCFPPMFQHLQPLPDWALDDQATFCPHLNRCCWFGWNLLLHVFGNCECARLGSCSTRSTDSPRVTNRLGTAGLFLSQKCS